MEQPVDADSRTELKVPQEPKVPQELWWSVLLEGIIAIIVGIFLLYEPIATTILLIQILAIFWLVEGIFSFIRALVFTRDGKWKLLSGILSIIAGAVILMYPVISPYIVLRLLIIFIGILALVNGAVIITSALKGGDWGTGILGALTIVLGLLLLTNSLAGVIILPWIFGVFFVIGGIGAVIWGIKMRT
ncbi:MULTISPECIES: HdeD family acid-resistance protein [Methanosarcina]|uniref:HdeD family acid-resistance protein n=2 Tax=Methanosarcina mazei TaxID=2209 RepID=A0A0F8PQR4_METMZ|nr:MULTISPECIES: HdeD family acid-resistance protein [Methanosarcina]KKG00698.1 hypothetical protein DU31_13985 [Methanosarcina mazei]KKG02119.1 hypothetical protein DU40_14045 [Methanosarcina mazei]KKG07061.1 hypothetical protein DU47_04500 [Methanosarcina mazei]KKG37997.1 hypothetical protein DU30_17775 [Methanosarcina mazei]KKG56950.1 hypothetical protein DU33_15545 [Methanosarcina mazei]